ITRFIRRLLTKTKFTFDEKILDIFHGPIFISIILLGLLLATDRLNFPQTISFVTTGCLKTVSILLWSKAAYRLFSLIIEIVSRDNQRSNVIQERTRPLFINLVLVIVF